MTQVLDVCRQTAGAYDSATVQLRAVPVSDILGTHKNDCQAVDGIEVLNCAASSPTDPNDFNAHPAGQIGLSSATSHET